AVVISGYYREPAQKYTGGKCRKLEGLDEICEDIKIHHTTGLAYLTCGDEQSRKTKWFPPNEDFSLHGFGMYEDPAES
ncbi:30472_t:CDS:2, partial [Racocetra persica]